MIVDDKCNNEVEANEYQEYRKRTQKTNLQKNGNLNIEMQLLMNRQTVMERSEYLTKYQLSIQYKIDSESGTRSLEGRFFSVMLVCSFKFEWFMMKLQL